MYGNLPQLQTIPGNRPLNRRSPRTAKRVVESPRGKLRWNVLQDLRDEPHRRGRRSVHAVRRQREVHETQTRRHSWPVQVSPPPKRVHRSDQWHASSHSNAHGNGVPR
uniref:(northern house mosquito) hypothetical protein n=2 Tax=Culex pipiens TaxID=7175 RepID=A0A8D8NI41_CULPI